MTFEEQIERFKIDKQGSWKESIDSLNSEVDPCSPITRQWYEFWKTQHAWRDITSHLNVFTCETVDRCNKCGLLRLGN